MEEKEKPTTPPSKKLHPLANQIPGWLDVIIKNPGLKTEYQDYLQNLLSIYREKQDNADDTIAFAKIRGAVEILKDQLAFVSNWVIEARRRESHDE